MCDSKRETLKPPYNYHKAFAYFISGLILLRLAMSLYLDLTPDECYYWELSRRLDWSYFDHPPMVAYIIAFFRIFFGDSQLAVRLPSVLGIALASWILFKIGCNFLKSSKVGFLAAVIFNLTPAGMAVGFITTPDTPLALFWLIATYSFLKALNDQKDFWWLITGLSLGAGALSKYNMIFFVPGVAVTILAFKRYRYLVATRRYWLMVLFAALGTFPILYWNMTHDWASFKFQFDHGMTANNKGMLKNVGEFLGGQLGTIGLTLFPVLWFVVVTRIKNSWKSNDETRFFLAWTALPMMAFFVYTGLRAKVEANWPQISYITAMLLAAEWIAAGKNNRRRNWVVGPSAFLAFLAVLQSLTMILPIPPKSDISTRLHGWRQMGEKVKKVRSDLPKNSIVLVQGAPLAATVGFYADVKPANLAEIHAAKNFRFWWNRDSLASGTNVVYVDDNDNSEAVHHAEKFEESQSIALPIYVNKKQIKQINVTVMKNLQKQLIFK
jgi:4-amino-4-deoxy-L-arabinose transferase-like glycosyltransferase